MYGHVNHANYVHYLETARVEALEAVGLALPEMRRQGYLIVAAEINVKYLAPAYPGETSRSSPGSARSAGLGRSGRRRFAKRRASV